MLGHLILSWRSLRLSSFYLICFSFFHSDSFISTILSSTSLNLSSASIILLFVAYRVFFISFIALFQRRQCTPLQYSCLQNPMDGGAWSAAVHGITKSRTRLSDFTFTFHCHALEKEMATHSSVLAWRIPETEELGRVPSLGMHRV